MYDKKQKNGSYMIQAQGRKQYFLHALLYGSLGIAEVMLDYACML